MGGVPHVEGVNNELYANVPVKRRQPKEKQLQQLQNHLDHPNKENSLDSEDKDENLPPGWEKHEGTFVWYISHLFIAIVIEWYDESYVIYISNFR